MPKSWTDTDKNQPCTHNSARSQMAEGILHKIAGDRIKVFSTGSEPTSIHPLAINEYLYENRPDATMEHLLDMADADVLVCGHTHIPHHRILPSGRHIVNAGSMGKPKDGNCEACYVILDASDSNLNVTFQRVPYDVERAALAIEASEMPNEYAEMLGIGTG